MNPTTTFAYAAMALASLAVWSGPAAMAQESTRMQQRTISVAAEGGVLAKPDIARISSGVVSEARTARDALSANSATMQKLIAALKEAGFAAADLQTASISVNPRYTHNRDGQAPRIDGYSVSNSLTVVVRDLKRLGEVLDQLVTLGANHIGGLAFDVAKADDLRDEARKAAIANARKRAELYAAAAGVKLGDVVSISEGDVAIAPRGPMLARAAMHDAVPIEEGSQMLEAKVSVVWELR